MRKTLILILTLCALVSAQRRQSVAVLPSVADRNALDQQGLILLTDKVLEIATKNLPMGSFILLKQDAIIRRIGEEELFRACKEGVCVGELTKKVDADYGARCDVVKRDGDLVLKFELYSVKDEAILETFTDFDVKNFRGMITVLEKRLPDAFKKMRSVTVSFDANGGSGAVPGVQTVTTGFSITLPNQGGLTRNGYTFGGWNTSSSGSGADHSAGSFYTPAGNTTMYARWSAVSVQTAYTVTFNANYGTGTAPNMQIAYPGYGITLPSQGNLSRKGYVFDGWNTNISGTGDNYSVGSSYTPAGNVTLYARWNVVFTPFTNTITFNANGGGGTAPGTQSVNSGYSLTLPSGSGLSRSGYTFGGWNTNSSGTGDNYRAGSLYTLTGDVTLYAKWNAVPIPVTYTVTLNTNDGSDAPPVIQRGVRAGYSITLPSGGRLSRRGYIFVDWNTNSSGTGNSYSVGSLYKPAGNVTLYAKWDTVPTPPPPPPAPIIYTVTFNANGGSGAVPGAQPVNAGSAITLPSGESLLRNGYVFGGWNTNHSGTGSNYRIGLSYTPAGDVTLYAKWNVVLTPVVYTIIFNANGGSGAVPGAQSVNAGAVITLPSGDGLSRSGYTFGGWNSNSSGTGINYSVGSSHTLANNITLYAKWDAIFVPAIYTVTFSANEGNGNVPKVQAVYAGSSITLPGHGNLTKSEYNFSGWNTNRSGTGTNYVANSSYTPAGNVTLYARWSSDIFVDNRDGKSYNTVTIGTQTWMAENLNYDVPGTATDVCYENIAANCATYGRLYDWSAAKKACPAGWHLPSDAEWAKLEKYLGGSLKAGTKLKSSTGWKPYSGVPTITNHSKFSALPGGSGGGFSNLGSDAYWWSATEYDANNAWRRYMDYSHEDLGRFYDSKTRLYSVRCVQNN